MKLEAEGAFAVLLEGEAILDKRRFRKGILL